MLGLRICNLGRHEMALWPRVPEARTMSNLPEKHPKPKVRCMDCDELDLADWWCLGYKKDVRQMRDIYEEKACAKYKEVVK